MRGRVALVALVLLVATLGVIFLPDIRFAYRAPAAAVGVSTANGLIAGLAAYLVFGRYRRTHSSDDLLLLVALFLLAFTSLALSALPRAINSLQTQPFSLWAPAVGRTLGAGALLAAASIPRRRRARPLRSAVIAGSAALVVVTGVAAVVGLLSPQLPVGAELGITPADLGHPQIVGPPALLGLRIVAIVLYVSAIFMFVRRFETTRDGLMGWLALASTFAAFAGVHQLLFPTVFPNHIYTADALRLGFSLVLLLGALQEIRGYWEATARSRVLEERRRIARDLHDGLAQELAFIRTKTSEIDRAQGDVVIRQIRAAAERALGESRRAIAALSRPVDEPLDVGLAQIAEELTDRAGVTLQLDVANDVKVLPDTREGVLRIAREAITNAIRHARPDVITVHLSDSGAIQLRIQDDGVGFDADSPRRDRTSFGLISMRERAESLGAAFRVSSRPAAGTEVEVVLPSESRSGSS